MTDWLGVANQLAAANDLSTLIRVFCHTLTNDFNAKRCVFIGVTPDGRQLVTLNHDIQQSWNVGDFVSPLAHVLQSGQQKVINSEHLIYWQEDKAFSSLLGHVGDGDKVLITPLKDDVSEASDHVMALAVYVVDVVSWNNSQWQDNWNLYFPRFIELYTHHWQKLNEIEKATTLKGRLRESLNLVEQTQAISNKSDLIKQNLVGDSACMKKLREQVAVASQSDMTVLIQGDTGVGKEVVAASIHEQSSRSRQSLVAINCAAIPENLLESELFGYSKGAFSGATTDKTGLIALADGGTLFLDEIGDMPLMLQAKLLRVLETRKYRPLGSDKEQESDFRLLAATHVALQEKIEQKLFRQDLFYRLYQFPVHVPCLKDRDDDIHILAKHFIVKFNQDNNANVVGIHFEVLDALSQHDFPGNVRELRNLIEFGCSHANDGEPLMYNHLSHYLNAQNESVVAENSEELGVEEEQELVSISDLRSAVKDYESKIIAMRLKQFKGNRSLAAESLGIPKRTLADKCTKMEIVL